MLFPLAIVEGPLLAVVAGFLCVNNLLNPLIVFPIIVAGDITGDSLCYLLGRVGIPGILKKGARWLGFTADSISSVKLFYDANPNKIISLSKLTPGVGFAGIYLAGNIKIPYKKFIRICLVTSILQYVVYLGIGLVFGNAYLQVSRYMNMATALCSVIAVTAFLLLFMNHKRKQL